MGVLAAPPLVLKSSFVVQYRDKRHRRFVMDNGTDRSPTDCLECGRPLSLAAIARGGLRHRECNNRVIAARKAAATAKTDDWLLEQIVTRSATDIARELGLTRQAIYHRVQRAKSRVTA
jgi:hypothetical protein